MNKTNFEKFKEEGTEEQFNELIKLASVNYGKLIKIETDSEERFKEMDEEVAAGLGMSLDKDEAEAAIKGLKGALSRQIKDHLERISEERGFSMKSMKDILEKFNSKNQ